MAVKIVRQPNKLVLLGVPTSAAALYAGARRRSLGFACGRSHFAVLNLPATKLTIWAMILPRSYRHDDESPARPKSTRCYRLPRGSETSGRTGGKIRSASHSLLAAIVPSRWGLLLVCAAIFAMSA